MPYPTFYHLPEEKQQRLLDAIWQEFTTVSYMDVSINRIIQTAGISRGSFYQYFAGKQDVFSYLLGTILQTVREMFQAQLTVHGNDLFTAIPGMYDLILWKKSKPRYGENQQKIHNLMRLNFELDLTQFTAELGLEDMVSGLQTLLQQSGYRVQTLQECAALAHLLLSCGLSNLADTLRHPEKEAQNRTQLELQLDLIRRGLLPEPEAGHGEAVHS